LKEIDTKQTGNDIDVIGNSIKEQLLSDIENSAKKKKVKRDEQG
jgi:hypothetical protein